MIARLSGLLTFQGISMLLILIISGVLTCGAIIRRPNSFPLAGPLLAGGSADVMVLLALWPTRATLANDEVTWHNLATQAAATLRGDLAPGVSYVPGKEGYIWILGALYTLGGATPMLAIVLNWILHSLLILTVAWTTDLMVIKSGWTNEQRARVVSGSAWLAALLPIFAIWTPSVLRESLSQFLVALPVGLVVKGITRRQWRYVITSIFPLLVLFLVRGTLGVTVAAALLSGTLFVAAGRLRYRLLLRTGLIVAIPVALPRVLNLTFNYFHISSDSVAISTAELSAIAGSGFPGIGRGSSIESIVGVTGPRVLLGPFPWEFDLSAVMVLAGIEWVCWSIVVVLTWRAFRLSRNDAQLRGVADVFVLLIFSAAIVLVGLMFSVGNYGILARFRPLATVILLPIAAVGLFQPYPRSIRKGSPASIGRHNEVLL